MEEHRINTEFGTLWTATSEPKTVSSRNPAILFLHGNSSSSRIFDPLLLSAELKDRYKLIVFDYPGHGRSSDAPDPDRSYYQYGYAEAALEVLLHYKVKQVIVLGWSVGGHVALELVSVITASLNPVDISIAGIMITGTPPVPRLQIHGFRSDADLSALFNPDASKEDLVKVAAYFTRDTPPTWVVDDILRTNRLAGTTMVAQFMQGKCSDQVKIVHDFQGRWVAVVNGEDEPILDLEYVDLACKGAPRLWRGECIRVKDGRHTLFFNDPKGFLVLFSDFVKDCINL